MLVPWLLGCGVLPFDFSLSSDGLAVPEGNSEGERLPDPGFWDAYGDDLVVSTVEGEPLVIEVVTLWASDVTEPISAELDGAYADEGLQSIIFVVQDASSGPADQDDARAYADAFDRDPVVWDPTGRATELLTSTSFPLYWVLDEDGIVFGRGPDPFPIVDEYYASRE